MSQLKNAPGVAIGRYPEDKYGGTHFNAGNPWVLITTAFARYSYLTTAEFKKQRHLKSATAFKEKGDLFLKRIQFHAPIAVSLSEQIDKDSGAMTSAFELTWNYSELLQAIWSRDSARR